MTGPSPFHAGERAVQVRAGVGEAAEAIASFIRSEMPDQHRTFHASLPFLVIAGRDDGGRVWASLLDGPDGFIAAPGPRRLDIAARPGRDDPLRDAFDGGAEIGLLGIELATRRRNRVNGRAVAEGEGLRIDVAQAFGNCPQYIHPRAVTRDAAAPGPARAGARLDADQIARVTAADTFFVATGAGAGAGMDASHRGGPQGFVTVAPDGASLRFPDYAGNNFFNTLGNLQDDPRAGLLFVDFDTGGLLHLTGRMRVDWTEGREARRHLDMEIEGVVDRPGALALRWAAPEAALRRLVLLRKRPEGGAVTSFTFAAEDGAPLPTFAPGQHLPIRAASPTGPPLERSYSLSGPPDAGTWRISVKRDPRGAVSRLLHDGLAEGDGIEALPPAGDFGPADPSAPLALISAGIGVTPMLAHLHAADGSRPVWFLHGARNGAEVAHAAEIRALAERHPATVMRTAFSRPGPDDIVGRDCDWTGRLTAERVLETVDDPGAHYLLCGPPAFVAALRGGLLEAGIHEDRLVEETF